MFLQLVFIIIGFALLIWGADLLVSGSSQIAARFGLPDRVIGLTVVAVGTAMPELVVSVVSAVEGHADMAFGNVVGSCIANLLLILGMSAVIMAAGTVICMAASAPLIGLFSSNPETIAIGQTALRIICLGFVVSAVSTTSSGALEGLGKGAASLVISLCRYVIFIMPLAWLLCRQLGPTGVWHAFWVTEVLSAVIAFAVYRKSVIKK